MTLDEERVDNPSIQNLPDDVLYTIFDYCSIQDLGRLTSTCQRFARLLAHDTVWKRHFQPLTLVFSERCDKGSQMPWMSRSGDGALWISHQAVIRRYSAVGRSGRLAATAMLRGPGPADVGRFTARGGRLAAGARDGSISVYDLALAAAGHHGHHGNAVPPTHHVPRAHAGDVHSVDFHRDTLVSGSRDATVKVWRLPDSGSAGVTLQYTCDLQDRVWSVAVSPGGASFVAGTAGVHSNNPLTMWDTASGVSMGRLGRGWRHGAGILQAAFLTDTTLLSAGYDTVIRLWDTRAQTHRCVACWEEPFDCAVYCVESDGRSLLAGTARHGLVRLWDTRMHRHVQMYYVGGRVSSPVYSLAADARRLYAALDKGVHLLDFSEAPADTR